MLPNFKKTPDQSSILIKTFGGINITAAGKHGELTDCRNVSMRNYPTLSSRTRRKIHSVCEGTINGVGFCDGYFYTYYMPDDKKIFLCYQNKTYEFTSYSNSDDYTKKRKFAKTENSIIIIPDNVVFYTDTFKFKSIDINMNKSQVEVEKKAEKEFGKEHGINLFGSSKEIGSVAHNCISTRYADRIPVGNNIYAFYYFAFGESIEPGDVITIKMEAYSKNTELTPEHEELKKTFREGVVAKVKETVKSKHLTLSGEYKTEITALIFEDNAFITNNYSDIVFTQINISKKTPEFTAITSFNNRVWGVSEKKIFASALGDGDEWNDFSADSYGTLPTSSFSASSGTDGNFTAIIPHGNFIYALKENYIHKIYGDSPDEYTISAINAPGALENADTLCVCGTQLMYASAEGVCILKDGYPKIVSQKIGNIYPVCACAQGKDFYIICQEGNERILYIYDTEHDCWTAQTCADNADNLCSDKNSVCFSQGKELIYIKSEDDVPFYEKHVSWNFSMRFDSNEFFHKTALRAMARVSLGKNAAFTARLIYDDKSESAVCGFCYDETQYGSCLLLLPIKRDIGFTLEFNGFGDFSLKSLKFNFYKGNEQ